MIHVQGPKVRLSWRERLLATVLVGSLALPFVPVPGDGMAHMKAVRLDEIRAEPVKIATQAPKSVCEVLAFSLSYENPETGAYTHVACKQPR